MKKIIITVLVLCVIIPVAICASMLMVQDVEQVTVEQTIEVQSDEETVLMPEEDDVESPTVIDALFPEEYSSERTESISFIMLHFTSDALENPTDPYDIDRVIDIFLDYEVSIHYIIDRDGQIYQCVDEERVAWHAGVGEWDDNKQYTNRMNQYSIGIELLGIGTFEEMQIYMDQAQYDSIAPEDIGFTEEQYEALNLLLADIVARNEEIDYDRDHIIGHDEYSEAKNDPGELFDWSKIGL